MIAHSSALFQQSDSPLKQGGRHDSGGLQRLTLSPTPERFNSPQAGSGLRCGRLSRNGSCYWRVRRAEKKVVVLSLPPSWREVE
jgi:hypothetical protein